MAGAQLKPYSYYHWSKQFIARLQHQYVPLSEDHFLISLSSICTLKDQHDATARRMATHSHQRHD